MAEKTVQEIIAEHQRKAGGILSSYQDRIRGITEDDKIDDPFAERVSPEERFRILREMKAEKATEVYDKTVEAYDREIGRFHSELGLRRDELEARLFGLAGSDGSATAALAQAAMATNDQLSQMLDLAALAGNDELAKTVFVTAHRRELGDIVARYFDEVDEEARLLYAEYQQVPEAAMLERQKETAERIIEEPSAEMLAGSPAVNR